MNEISAVTRRAMREMLSLPHEDTEKGVLWQTRKRALTRNRMGWCLDLELPSLQHCKK